MAADGPPSVRRDAVGRLVGESDRHGTLLSELHWAPDGRLRRARVRLPDGSWAGIDPGGAAAGPWGPSDALLHNDRRVTAFAALDWARVARIPPLAEPAKLPPGAGTAILNLLARLAADQATTTLRYEGPYPTEQLFLALLESFRFRGEAAGDPLAAFMAGGLVWTPAPHARSFESGGVYVQRRERIEKVVVDGRAFYRQDWQGVRRRGARVVRDAAGTVRASLCALGVVLEDRLVLDRDGSVLDRPRPTPDPPAIRPLPPALVRGVVAVVAAHSAPALSGFVRRTATALGFEWGPVEDDFVLVAPTRIRLSPRLLRAIRSVLDGSATRADRLRAGVAGLGEAAHLVGDELRRHAQALLADADAETQSAALQQISGSEPGDAPAIAAAVETLLAEAAQVA